MRDFFLHKNIKSGLKRNKKDHLFLNYKDIKNLLILFDIESYNELIPIVEDLIQDGIQISAWTVKAKGSSVPQLPSYVKVIQPEDITWTGLVKDEVLKEFSSLTYDTLIDLSLSQNDYLLLLLSISQSHFCVGLMEREYNPYDFILLKNEDHSLFDTYGHLKNFLRQLR